MKPIIFLLAAAFVARGTRYPVYSVLHGWKKGLASFTVSDLETGSSIDNDPNADKAIAKIRE